MSPPNKAKTPQEISAEHWKAHGNALFQKSDYEGAVAAYNTAIINDPRLTACFTNRALCYLKLGKPSSAAQDARKAVELEKDNVKGHFYLGWALSDAIWARAEAEEAKRIARVKRERMEAAGYRESNEKDDDEAEELDGSLAEAVDELTIGGYLVLFPFGSKAKRTPDFPAYHLALNSKPPSTFTNAIQDILRKARRRRWDLQSRRAERKESETEALLVSLLERERQRQIEQLLPSSPEDLSEEDRESNRKRLSSLHSSFDSHLASLHSAFHKLHNAHSSHTINSSSIPDPLLGKIHFGLLLDPVITPSGITYDRTEILDHLRTIGRWDPLSRRPLKEEDLVPNLALKEVVEEFLNGNGWAVDS